jgi:hypothetical protein
LGCALGASGNLNFSSRGHVGASSGNLGRAEGYHAQYSSIIVLLCKRKGKCQVAQTFDHGLYSIRKFDGKNYKLWAFEMEMLLSREQAWTIVNGSEPSPPEPEEVEKDGKAAHKAMDYKWRYFEALRLIFSALEESLKHSYMHIRHPIDWGNRRHHPRSPRI